QYPPETSLSGRYLPVAAPADPDRPDDEPRNGRGLALLARPVRWPPIGAIAPLYRGDAHPAVHRHPFDHGRAGRSGERDPLDDHRLVPPATGKGEGMIDRRKLIGAIGLG